MTAHRALVAVAAGLAAVAGLAFALGPSYSMGSETLVEASPPGAPAPTARVREGRTSGLAANGARLLPVVLVPVLIAGAPLLVPWRSVRAAAGGAAALLLAFVVVASFSIGLLYLPSIAALAAAAVPPARRR